MTATTSPTIDVVKSSGSVANPKPTINNIFDLDPLALEQIAQWIEQRGISIPLSQVTGYQQAIQSAAFVTASGSEQSSEISFSNTTYTSYSGPTISGLADGSYFLIYGCSAQVNGSQQLFMAPSINGSTPSDSQAVEVTSSSNNSYSRALLANLSNSNSNTVELKYRVQGSDGSARYRWLIALKYGS